MPSPTLRALIFDVDGTLADTENAHRLAFNEAFAAAGLDWQWDEPLYTRLLEISGGKERITHYWESRADFPAGQAARVAETVQRLHEAKTRAYLRLADEGALTLRPGVRELIEAAPAAGLRLAIATTTTPANIEALLRRPLGDDWQSRFEIIEDGLTAPHKKPHPQAYRQALGRLRLQAEECVAIEDSANGLSAALQAGLPVVVTPNPFTARQDFRGALRVVPNLQDVSVGDLRAWHAGAVRIACHR